MQTTRKHLLSLIAVIASTAMLSVVVLTVGHRSGWGAVGHHAAWIWAMEACKWVWIVVITLVEARRTGDFTRTASAMLGVGFITDFALLQVLRQAS